MGVVQPAGEMVRFAFRKEMLAARAERLNGDITIFAPISWQLVGVAIAGIVLVALGALASASFARTVAVVGRLTPDGGMVEVSPVRSGVVTRLRVEVGDEVRTGEVLAVVEPGENLLSGASLSSALSGELQRQRGSIDAQVRAGSQAAAAQQQRFSVQMAEAAAEIELLHRQVALQEALVASAAEDIERASQIAVRGFISARDMQGRRDLLVGRQQSLAQLQQNLASKRGALSEMGQARAEARAGTAQQQAVLAGATAQVDQQVASIEAAGRQTIVSPVSGSVTAVLVRAGQRATGDKPVATILPSNSRLLARLTVPSAAIGFVKPGQRARLALDSFPYQRFGTIGARVVSVDGSATPQTLSDGSTDLVYGVAMALDRPSIRVHGVDEVFRPGMLVTARITTDRQTFMQWLFEPLFAVARR